MGVSRQSGCGKRSKGRSNAGPMSSEVDDIVCGRLAVVPPATAQGWHGCVWRMIMTLCRLDNRLGREMSSRLGRAYKNYNAFEKRFELMPERASEICYSLLKFQNDESKTPIKQVVDNVDSGVWVFATVALDELSEATNGRMVVLALRKWSPDPVDLSPLLYKHCDDAYYPVFAVREKNKFQSFQI